MERRVRAERGPSARERCGNDWHSPPVFMGRVNQMPIFRDVPEEASNRYGKLLTRLTGSRKARKLAIIQAFCASRDPVSDGRGRGVGSGNVEPPCSVSPFVSSAPAFWLTAGQTGVARGSALPPCRLQSEPTSRFLRPALWQPDSNFGLEGRHYILDRCERDSRLLGLSCPGKHGGRRRRIRSTGRAAPAT